MLVGLVDFVVPFCGPSLTGYSTWTETEEEKFTEICVQISSLHSDVIHTFHSLSNMRQQNAKFFFVAVMTFLSLTAWVGHQVDNLLLVYLIATFLLLLPGLKHHGMIDRVLLPLTEVMKKIKNGTPKDKTT